MTSWLNSGPTKNPCRSAVNSLGVDLSKERIINTFLTNSLDIRGFKKKFKADVKKFDLFSPNP